MTAMTAATLDTLSGGRFRLGLGVSGPQVSEGWHGVRFDKPLARTREYVEIVRMALAPRAGRATTGEHFTLPLPDGPGKALKLTVHPVREHIPIYLAAVGPKNLELTGEIADGWLAIFFAPSTPASRWRHVRGGPGARPAAGPWTASTSCRPCRSSSATTSRRAPTPVRAVRRALRRRHGQPRSRTSTTSSPCGWATSEAAAEVQDLYLASDYAGAAAAVPLEFIDQTSLLGPRGADRATGCRRTPRPASPR